VLALRLNVMEGEGGLPYLTFNHCWTESFEESMLTYSFIARHLRPRQAKGRRAAACHCRGEEDWWSLDVSERFYSDRMDGYVRRYGGNERLSELECRDGEVDGFISVMLRVAMSWL
jgi:hypothetical protein